MIIFGVFYLV